MRLVHGPIQAHLDWLQIRNASLVVRGSLREICLSQNIFLKKNAANLQPFFRWKKPIRHMKWSGNEATPNLTQELLKLSKTNVMATISHGLGTLDELEDALEHYDGHVEELIIFHLDEGDYR